MRGRSGTACPGIHVPLGTVLKKSEGSFRDLLCENEETLKINDRKGVPYGRM
jgi:hypothetical protein